MIMDSSGFCRCTQQRTQSTIIFLPRSGAYSAPQKRFTHRRLNYSVAYTGKASALNPEELFCIYNDEFPRREKARSLSVSDIIEYTFPSGERLYLFCDSFGFDPVDFGDNYRVCKEAEYLPQSAKQTESG